MELLTDQGLRIDGRRPNELRRIKCEIGIDDDCDGSAFLQHGSTKVLARVYGPQEVSSHLKSKTLTNSAFVNCHFVNTTVGSDERMTWSNTDKKNVEMRLSLQHTLNSTIKVELYPKSQIDVCVEILEEDGSHFCTTLNACVLALIDAGIPISEYAIGCTASIVKEMPMVDINNLEETQGGPVLSLVIFPISGQIIHMQMSQRFHVDHLGNVIKVAKKGCKDIYNILDASVRAYLNHAGAAYQWGREGTTHTVAPS